MDDECCEAIAMKSNLRSCVGKARYTKEEYANEAARRSERERHTTKLQAYFCRKCKRWHIGHIGIERFR